MTAAQWGRLKEILRRCLPEERKDGKKAIAKPHGIAFTPPARESRKTWLSFFSLLRFRLHSDKMAAAQWVGKKKKRLPSAAAIYTGTIKYLEQTTYIISFMVGQNQETKKHMLLALLADMRFCSLIARTILPLDAPGIPSGR